MGNVQAPWPDSGYLRRDFESCVLEGDQECSWMEGQTFQDEEVGHKRQMAQFCGQESWCSAINSQRVMMSAMANVEEHYVVVGVAELWQESLEVLEHFLPQFFLGAVNFDHARGSKKVNSNHWKPFVTEEIRSIVAQSNSREIEFYNFCVERLKRQLLELRAERSLKKCQTVT